jgi:hypothetical protein
MKRILLIASLLIISIINYAGLPSDAVFQKYSATEGIDISAIPSFLLKPFVENIIINLKDEDKAKITVYLDKINNICIAKTNANTKLGKSFLKEANKLSINTEYAELIHLKDTNSMVKIVSHKANNNIDEILAYGLNNNEVLLVSIQGEFTEAMINEIVKEAVKRFKF